MTKPNVDYRFEPTPFREAMFAWHGGSRSDAFFRGLGERAIVVVEYESPEVFQDLKTYVQRHAPGALVEFEQDLKPDLIESMDYTNIFYDAGKPDGYDKYLRVILPNLKGGLVLGIPIGYEIEVPRRHYYTRFGRGQNSLLTIWPVVAYAIVDEPAQDEKASGNGN